ncbi:MAG: tRNA (guanosine(37)-N1)-methyltransferase TrmD [Gammaproteobacteria bacterium]|nr:tRNA (guanosine(37)-N1)-methyltransferase TrmD [Gammaproteobacteria bacterium]
MDVQVITIFPEMFDAITRCGITGRAVNQNRVRLRFWNPREFASGPHRSVDGRPYGGGPGMVMKPAPVEAAVCAARNAAPPEVPVIHLSPQGRLIDHRAINRFSCQPGLILLAGRYEGIDERVLTVCVDEEWSIGDYVLSGGELAAMVVIDAVVRRLPGVVGNADSVRQDSFEQGLLDCGHYTRPERFHGQSVPEVLLSGDHEAIRRWRLKQSLGRTWARRPDLLTGMDLTPEQTELLQEYQREAAMQEKCHG